MRWWLVKLWTAKASDHGTILHSVSNYPPNDELNFLLREEPPDTGRWLRAGGGTVVFHLILAVILTNAPLFEGPHPQNAQSEIQPPKVITPLVAPILEPTQKEANKAKLDRSFDVDSLRPKEVVQVPKTAPATPQPAPQAPAQTYIPPTPEQPKPQTQPTPKVPDTPKVEVAENKPAQRPQQGVQTQTPIAPQPQIQQQEKPKLSFETPGTASMGNQNGGSRCSAPGLTAPAPVRRNFSATGPLRKYWFKTSLKRRLKPGPGRCAHRICT